MAELRSTLGSGAIILNSESASNGVVTLRAAVEHEGAQDQSQYASGWSGADDYDSGETDSALGAIEQALAFHRAPPPVNTLLLQTVEAMLGDDPVQALAAALETRYSFSPLPTSLVRPVLLIGPAGAGKTITAAKLAARSILAGRKAALITTDLLRTGGAEQLAAYAATMNVPCHRAADGARLAELIEAQDPAASCIIDSCGASPYNLTELNSLKKFVMAIDCDPIVVLPAGCDSVEMCEMVNIYSGLGARGLIVTKLDASRRLGCIIGALETAAMILHHVSITPYIANGLAPVTAVTLARLLLEDPAEHESFSDLELAAQ